MRKIKKVLIIQDYFQMSDVKNQKIFSSALATQFKDSIKNCGVECELKFATMYSAFPLLDDGNVKPTTEQAREARATIMEKILQEKPDIIVPLGTQIMKVLTGSVAFATEIGGVIHITKLGKFDFIASVIPMYHPEKVLEFPNFLEKINHALGALLKELKSTTTVFDTATDRVLSGLDYQSLETVADVKTALELMKSAPIVACDIETTGLEYWHKTDEIRLVDDKTVTIPKSKVICISFSYKERQGYVIPLDHDETPFDDNELKEVKALLKDFLESDVPIVGHNFKFDRSWLSTVLGINTKNWVFDTQYAHFIAISEEPGTQGLKYNAVLYTDIGNYEEELQNFLDTLPADIRYNYGNVPWEILRRYAMADTDACLRLYNKFKPLIDGNEEWHWLMDELYIPAAKVLGDIEMCGIHFDTELAEQYQTSYSNELAKLAAELNNNPAVIELEKEKRALWLEREQIRKIPKKERTEEEQSKFEKYKKYENYKFAWSSPNALRELLFDKLKLPVVEKTDNGEPSTSETALEELSKINDIPKLLLKWRKLDTLTKMFINQLPSMVDQETNCIHPTFGIHLTATGRTNCQNPKSCKLGL